MGLTDTLQRWLARLSAGREKHGDTWSEPPADGADLASLESKLGYQFARQQLLENALLHRSHIHVTGNHRIESNERLEFLGDAVLGLVVNEHLFAHYPDESEGDLTKMKSLLVCGARLSEVGGVLALGQYIRMSRSEAATGGRRRSSILADTMEALIGAVYLDGGLDAARGVIERVMLSESDTVLERRSQGNYKSRLQEIIQARFKSPPRYRVLTAEGPDHARVFIVGVTFAGMLLGQGEGRNKKAAEQQAAAAALRRLRDEPGLLDDLIVDE
jgi:ribonuclease-3